MLSKSRAKLGLGKVGILIALLGASVFAQAGEMENLRGKRYCEILVTETRLSLAVYNTIGLNDCPEDIWKKITVQAVKEQTGASFVKLNGPRYWVIDGMVNSKLVNPEQKTITGLEMRKAGILKLGLSDLMISSKPYHKHTVDRQTTWIYKAGKPIYELIDPNGQVFVMQSYSAEKDPSQTMENLQNLESRLKLPKDWHFRMGVLRQDTELKAIDNKATVLQDDFLNTYQLASHDFLE